MKGKNVSLLQRLIGSTENAVKSLTIKADKEAKSSFLAHLKIWRESMARAEMMEHSDQEILKLATIISNYIKNIPETNDNDQRHRGRHD